MVEIDILSECKHKHVVGMYEAYYHDNKLWVSVKVKLHFITLHCIALQAHMPFDKPICTVHFL